MLSLLHAGSLSPPLPPDASDELKAAALMRSPAAAWHGQASGALVAVDFDLAGAPAPPFEACLLSGGIDPGPAAWPLKFLGQVGGRHGLAAWHWAGGWRGVNSEGCAASCVAWGSPCMVAMQRGGLLLAIEEAVRRMGLPCCMVGGIFSLLHGSGNIRIGSLEQKPPAEVGAARAVRLMAASLPVGRIRVCTYTWPVHGMPGIGMPGLVSCGLHTQPCGVSI